MWTLGFWTILFTSSIVLDRHFEVLLKRNGIRQVFKSFPDSTSFFLQVCYLSICIFEVVKLNEYWDYVPVEIASRFLCIINLNQQCHVRGTVCRSCKIRSFQKSDQAPCLRENVALKCNNFPTLFLMKYFDGFLEFVESQKWSKGLFCYCGIIMAPRWSGITGFCRGCHCHKVVSISSNSIVWKMKANVILENWFEEQWDSKIVDSS